MPIGAGRSLKVVSCSLVAATLIYPTTAASSGDAFSGLSPFLQDLFLTAIWSPERLQAVQDWPEYPGKSIAPDDRNAKTALLETYRVVSLQKDQEWSECADFELLSFNDWVHLSKVQQGVFYWEYFNKPVAVLDQKRGGFWSGITSIYVSLAVEGSTAAAEDVFDPSAHWFTRKAIDNLTIVWKNAVDNQLRSLDGFAIDLVGKESCGAFSILRVQISKK